MLALGQQLPTGDSLLYAFGAGVCGAVGLLALYRALSIGIMSIAAPISALAAVIPFAWGMLKGDSPRVLQLVGAAIAMAGALLAAREPSTSHVPRDKFRLSVGLALFSAVALGGGLVFLGYSAPGGAMPVLVADRIATSAITVPLALITGAGLGRRPKSWLGPAGVGVCDTSANALYILAFNSGGLMALIGVLASLYPVTTVLLARGVLGERLERHQLTGVAIALAGVVLIAA